MRRRGVMLAAVTAVVSGVAVYVNGFGVRAWGEAGVSSATYTTAKNLAAALALLVLTAAAGRVRSDEGFTRPATARRWWGLVTVGVVGGSVPFLLFFEGLSRASSSQAAFLHKTLVVWVMVLAVPLLRERVGPLHLAAVGMLVAGQAMMGGGVGELGWGSGEAMILAATVLWAVEVVIAKRLLADLSALTVGTARMTIGVAVLIAYGVVSGGFAGLGSLAPSHWWWIAATGATLTAYVATWYSALARAQAVDVTAVLVFGAVITVGLRAGFDGAALPSPAGLALVGAGTLLALLAARSARPVAEPSTG